MAGRILLTGASGQLGRHLAPILRRHGRLVTAARSGADVACDLAEPGAVAGLLERIDPAVVVNAAAFTAVDAAEDRPDAAFRLNRDVPGDLAGWCATAGRSLIHFSTDYVFSGVTFSGESGSGSSGRPWREIDPTEPGTVYGQSKLAGEQAIADHASGAGPGAVIIRTAWLYSRLPGNFLTAIFERAAAGEDLRVVADQTGSPTWAGNLARATGRLLECRDRLAAGVNLFHIADAGAMSWHEFAVMAVNEAARRHILDKPVRVIPINSAEWPQKAARPAWSVLDGSKFEQFSGRPLPDSRSGLDACLDEWEQDQC